MKAIKLFTIILLALPMGLLAQVTQTIRGTVTDNQSNSPLPGVAVIVVGSDPLIGTVTDINGSYKLEKVPVGRQTIKATYLGYDAAMVPNIVLNSAKETIQDIAMTEQVTKIEEVVISADKKGEQLNNEMVTVSARTLSMVEANKFSGTRNDPSRMAQNFAGVSGANDARNDIIIRGNSPIGVLWRMEGVNIPSPNHFATIGSTGGPVTMLNTNNLKNSDFLTGAFPAEYGNATAGVFDLQLRSGNNQKHEFLGQIGFNGFEFGAEGPFTKKSKASYIINYRYSTLGLLSAVGIKFGTGSSIPQYQDVTFKVNIPTEKAGKFTIFGVGGISYIGFKAKDATGESDLYSDKYHNSSVHSNTGFAGISHTYFFNENTYGKASFVISAVQTKFEADSLIGDLSTTTKVNDNSNTQLKYITSYQVNHKFSAKDKLTAGASLDVTKLNIDQKQILAGGSFGTIRQFNGVTELLQTFIQWQHRFSDKITLNSGIHHQHYFLNNTWAIEPRANLRYQFMPNQSISLGAGLHSQTQPIETYFVRTQQPDGSFAETNHNLGFTRSSQLVLGYDWGFAKDFRMKVEAYGQYLTNAPVDPTPSSFSMLNAGAGFTIPDNGNLVNKGKGYNYGLELTVEKFFSKGYYFLFTSSVFNSRYAGSDKVWHNTTFNGNYILNLLGGKEFKIGKRNVIAIDAKVTYAGGQRYTPIDLAASQAQHREVDIDSEAFSKRRPNYFRADIKLTYRLEGKRATQEFSVDLQNVANYKNVFQQQYDVNSGTIKTSYQIGFFPNVTYRILF